MGTMIHVMTMLILIARLSVFHKHRLLTLKSLPFRVVYSNDSYAQRSRGKSMIGDSVFQSFTSAHVPSLSLYPTLLQGLQKEASNVHVQASDENTSGVRCTIKAFPIGATKK